MNRSIAVNLLRGALGLALSCYVAVAAAQDAAPATQLQSIDVQKLGGKQVQLTLHLSGPAPEPLSFTIDKPARISLDLPNTASRWRHGASMSAPAASTRSWPPRPMVAHASC